MEATPERLFQDIEIAKGAYRNGQNQGSRGCCSSFVQQPGYPYYPLNPDFLF